MHSAGARVLREDDNEMSREAVLLQWERKIEVAERLEDESTDTSAGAEPVPLRPVAEQPRRGRFERRTAEPSAEPRNEERRAAEPSGEPRNEPRAAEPHTAELHAAERAPAAAGPASAPAAQAERRTITITGQPTPARRRRPVVDAQLAQPDRIALWAFLLGLLLVAVAAGTAHA
jgi:hypothetical protein